MKKGKFVILAVSASLIHGTATVSVCNGAAPIIMPPSLPADSPFDFPDDDPSPQDAAGSDESDLRESDSSPENQSSIAPGINQGLSRSTVASTPSETMNQQAVHTVVPVTPRPAGNSSNATVPKPVPLESPAVKASTEQPTAPAEPESSVVKQANLSKSKVSATAKPLESLPKSSMPRHESVKPIKAAGTTKPKPKLASKPSPRSMTGTTNKTKVKQDSAASADRANVHKSVTPPPAREPEVQLAAEPGLSARTSQSPSQRHQNSQPVWPPPGEGGKVNILPTLPR